MARIPGRGGGKSLLLTGHLDTVPPYNMENPYTLREESGRLRGLGAVDMKGPLACMMAAMEDLVISKSVLKGDLVFQAVADEEEKSLGTRRLLSEGAGYNGAVVGEPTSLNLCLGHRGLEWFEVRFFGKTVHGGSQEEGKNAISMARAFMNRVDACLLPAILSRRNSLLGSSTMNYGLISGGTQPSTVAGYCILRFDRRWVPGEKYDEIIAEYREILAELKKEDPEFNAEIRVMEESFMESGVYHEALVTSAQDPIVLAVKSAYRDYFGRDIEVTAFPGWTDAGLLSHYGCITSVVFGQGSIRTAHSAEEFINKEELLPAAEIYRNLAVKYCT